MTEADRLLRRIRELVRRLTDLERSHIRLVALRRGLYLSERGPNDQSA
jgi:hypothetical protein